MQHPNKTCSFRGQWPVSLSQQLVASPSQSRQGHVKVVDALIAGGADANKAHGFTS